MDPFVRRLVQRMLDPKRPLSRNRHFHTFATPEGRAALKTSRRLRSLQADILSCREEGHPARFLRVGVEDGEHRIELLLERVSGRRVSLLEPDEFALLLELDGIRDALEEATRAA
ncbi:MAG: hypothetical protein IRZ16_16530 [Myxococcaceae bacterium]|nr:hypothetical protein [Myxococcaceae bacterium]